jgi:hypothetical protein
MPATWGEHSLLSGDLSLPLTDHSFTLCRVCRVCRVWL